jgi:hypothetical protein
VLEIEITVIIQWLATEHSFGIISTLFTLGPRPPALSVLPEAIHFTGTAVCAQMLHLQRLWFKAELPFSINVVLWDGAAGGVLRMFVFVIRP